MAVDGTSNANADENYLVEEAEVYRYLADPFLNLERGARKPRSKAWLVPAKAKINTNLEDCFYIAERAANILFGKFLDLVSPKGHYRFTEHQSNKGSTTTGRPHPADWRYRAPELSILMFG